jgi:hypothetical protein
VARELNLITITSPDSSSSRAGAVCYQRGTSGVAEICRIVSQSVPSGVRTYNALIFGGGLVEPVRRIRVDVQDPRQIPATATALARALNRSGVDFNAEHDPQVPSSELWITFVDTQTVVMNIP